MSPNPAVLTWPRATRRLLVPTFIGGYGSKTGKTFTGIPIGAGSPTRTVVVAMTKAGYAQSGDSFDGTTINGTVATVTDQGIQYAHTSHGMAGVAFANIPTGETAEIVLGSTAGNSASVSVWVVDAILARHAGGSSSGTNSTFGGSVAVPAGGFAVFAAACARSIYDPVPTVQPPAVLRFYGTSANVDWGQHASMDCVESGTVTTSITFNGTAAGGGMGMTSFRAA